MKKIRNLKKVFALLLALCMCASASVTAFAAELDTPETPVDISSSVGPILYADSADFTKTVTIKIKMTQKDKDTDFLVGVLRNPGATYEVVMTMPNGAKCTTLVTGNAPNLTNMMTLSTAGKGTYSFKFTLVAGSEISAHAMVHICD